MERAPNPTQDCLCEIEALLQPAPVSMIPCAEQCHTVLSQLCKAKENNGTKFCYAQFSFGLVDIQTPKEITGTS